MIRLPMQLCIGSFFFIKKCIFLRFNLDIDSYDKLNIFAKFNLLKIRRNL